MADQYSDHPDAKEDAAQTVQLIEEQLTPVFELIGKMFEAADSRMNRIEELLGNVVDGMGEAVDQHKRSGIMERLDPFHGDMEQLSSIYSDFHEGKDYGEDLVDELMKSGDEITDEMISGKINEHKKKWGKYIGLQVPEEEEEGEESPGEEQGSGEQELQFEGGSDDVMEESGKMEHEEKAEKKPEKKKKKEEKKDDERETLKYPANSTSDRLRRAMNGGM